MLAYFLALAVGLGSFSIYMAAFFFPEVHRKSDFVWSGVGFFYALVLWACAGRITGALLLGQMAGVALLGWLAWETLSLRRQVTPAAQQTPIPELANLKGVAGVPLPGWFGQKKDTAPTKPKFVRSKKPKTEVAAPPVPDTGAVKVEEQPATPPVAELIVASSIEPTPSIALNPEIPIPDSIAPTTEPIPVWSIETPVADTPVASAPSSDTPLPLEISEIATAPTLEPAEAQPEVKPEPEVDDFEEAWRAAASSPAPTAAPTAAAATPPKVSKKSAGFGSLFDNIKNSLGGLLGRGADKSKPAATPQTPTPQVPPTAIEPASEIASTVAPDIDRVLESELAAATAETAAETSNTAVGEIAGVPFPPDIETMAELIATETATSAEIGETSIAPPATEAQTSSETEVAELAAASDEPAPLPTPPETTVVEVVSVTTVKIQESGDASDSSPKLEIEGIAIEVISIEPTGEEASQNAEKPELSGPNSPEFDRVEATKPAVESKSDNISSEGPPTA